MDMDKFRQRILLAVLTVPALLCWLAGQVLAADVSSGISQYIAVSGEAVDGAVICTDETGNSPCTRAYDPNMIGVVSLSPAVSFQVAILVRVLCQYWIAVKLMSWYRVKTVV